MKTNKRYKKEERELIIKMYKEEKSYDEIIDEIYKRFRHKRSRSGLQNLVYREGVAKPLRQYTKEELDYAKKLIKDHNINETTRLVNEKFGQERTVIGIKSALISRGISIGPSTKFKKGEKAHNKKELFSERIQSGYISIKVAEPDVWELKHRWLYEQHHKVKLKDDDTIIFKDGNKRNLDINNLAKISGREHLTMNREMLRSEYPEVTEAGIALAKLMVKQKEITEGGEED